MRPRLSLASAGIALLVAGCQNPMAPQSADDRRFPPSVNLQTGPANVCKGEVISSIASTWPWPETHEAFPPPPGSVALWLKLFGGGSSVRELHEELCGG